MIIRMPTIEITPAAGPHLGANHLAERTAVATGGEEQHQHVLHRAGKDHAEQDPQRTGQVAHLRGQDWADQRTGAGDRGEWWPKRRARSARSRGHRCVAGPASRGSDHLSALRAMYRP